MAPQCTCEHCGYDLSGLTARICPECGVDTPGPASALVPRTDARRVFSKWIGILGWFLVGASTLAVFAFWTGRTILALFCPGIPIVVALASFWPWYRILRRARFTRSLPDDLFVAAWPWTYVIMESLVAVPLLTSSP